MAGQRWIGYLFWAVIFGAGFAWEAFGLRSGSHVVTLSDALRAVMRSPVGRWALFALWLWFGWHVFVRGWHFLLRGPEGEPLPVPPGSDSGTGALLRHAVLPTVVGYLLVMGTLVAGWSSRHARRDGGIPAEVGPQHHGWPALARRVLATATGGYLLLFAVVLVYYYAVAGEDGHFLDSALSGTALLVGLAVPVWLVATWAAKRRRGHQPTPKG